MTMLSPQKQFRALWPLSGGNNRYLTTFIEILRRVGSTPVLSREAFVMWMTTHYNIGTSTANGCLQLAVRVGVLVQHDDDALGLTSLGRNILEADDDTQAHLVGTILLERCVAFYEVLECFAEESWPLHLSEVVEIVRKLFPEWKSETQFENRVLWLLSLGCVAKTQARTYQITPFGAKLLSTHKQNMLMPGRSPASIDLKTEQEALILIRELEAAAFDGQSPSRFEQAVADAIAFLGYEVEHLGQPGQPDVVARAYIGPESYTVILDTKSRCNGKLNTMELYTLQEHMDQLEADYAVIVAQDFANGRLTRQAEENGILLLSVSLVREWLLSHAAIPLNLYEYKRMFKHSGQLLGIPSEINYAMQQRKRWAELLVDLVELIQETYHHGLTQPLLAEQLFSMLVTRLHDVRYSLEEVQQATNLLTHPAMSGAMILRDKGIALAMTSSGLAHSYGSFAQLLESSHTD